VPSFPTPHLSLLTGYTDETYADAVYAPATWADEPYADGSYAPPAAAFASTALAALPADGPGEDAAWRLDALCAETDPEAFFPEKGGSTREAKRVCAGCAVRSECLEYALGNDERFGIWGGLSERERRRVRLARRMPLSA
jgi:WhiB family transcriptional regulator, redox-sensing transcriptional regulator